METNRLRQFCLIVETGSLSRAAELLHITHSALSKSMTSLQSELNIQLLQPSGRGISITEPGLKIYENAKTFLASEQAFFFGKSDEPQLELRIGTVEVFSRALTLGLRPMVESASMVLKIVDIEPGAMEQQIVAGHLDFGVTYLPFPQPSLRMTQVGVFKLGCFHRKEFFQKTEFKDLPFVVPAKVFPENPIGIKERDGWHDSLFQRKIAFKTNLLSTAIDLVNDGACAIIIPRFVASMFNRQLKTNGVELIEKALPPKLPALQNTAYVICRENHVEDQRLRAICKVIRSAVKAS